MNKRELEEDLKMTSSGRQFLEEAEPCEEVDFVQPHKKVSVNLKSCEDAVSKTGVFEIMGNLMSIPYDFDRQITEKDVSESMDEIRALPPVTPTILDKIRAEIMDFEEELFHRPNTNYTDYAAVRHCVEIIDKYRAESKKCKWILYDYRTLVPEDHGNIPNPYYDALQRQGLMVKTIG